MLATTAYGEGSSKDVFEEMAAIANVLVPQQKARGYASISAFIEADKTWAELIEKDAGMAAALKGAVNALAAAPFDYSNGTYFCDGAGVKTKHANHAKVLGGTRITDPAHNMSGMDDKSAPGETCWTPTARRPSRGAPGRTSTNRPPAGAAAFLEVQR